MSAQLSLAVAGETRISRAQLPPGPRGALWQTARYVRNPLRFYLDCAAKFGDVFTVPSVLGPIVAISHPSDLRALFSLPPAAFERWSVDAVRPLLGEHSVLLSSGAVHLAQRRMMAPAFHRERINALCGQVVAVAREHSDAWPVGDAFVLQERLVDLSIEVILRAVLGLDDARRLGRLRVAIRKTLASMSPVMMLARMVDDRLGALGPYARFRRARDELDHLLYMEIDAPAPSAGMLQVLRGVRDGDGAGFSREALRDQLMTLIFAGHETSAIGLAWGIYWLARNPRPLAFLLAELDATPHLDAETLTRLPYLDAVCKEALRLYPTVPEVIRKLNVPLQLGRVLLPAGIPVAACIVATHHREDLYRDADAFRPERFLERRFAAHEYLPFGGGVHRCAGEAFAWLEMKAILATLVTRLRFSLVDERDATPRLKSITMEPRGGIPVAIAARAP